MILSDADIEGAVRTMQIIIKPFDDARLGAFSYTLSLADRLYRSLPCGVIDPATLGPHMAHEQVEIGSEGYVLQPDTFVIGLIAERVAFTSKYAARLDGLRRLAGFGLQVLQGATYIDQVPKAVRLGIHEMLAIRNVGPSPILLTPGMDIVRIMFEQLSTPPVSPDGSPYAGHLTKRVWYV